MTMRPHYNHETTFGYLSALELPDHGFFGGYLVISPLGRPLEFHCTAPIRPSRAQQILYGPTLEPYLLGEQIGGTLLKKAELRPKVILTDQPAMLSLRGLSTAPIVCLVSTSSAAGEGPESVHALTGASATAAARSFALTGCEWELPFGYETEQPAVAELLRQLAKHVDVAEPFGRIHEAIREAQRISSGGSETNAHAA
jgi:hypothetical protein